MYNNYDYPMGADTPDAPWNEPILPEKEFEVTCCQTLSKTTSVITNNYIPGATWVECEDGMTIGGQDPDDTSGINWGEEYHENDHYTPLQLITLFKKYLENDLNRMGEVKNEKRIKHLIEECEEWTEDETEYLED